MPLNCYANLSVIKTRIGETATTYDTQILAMIEAASRSIDEDCGRYFYSRTETKYFDGTSHDLLLLPEDLLTVTTLTEDTEGDGTYDGTTWVEHTDFWCEPRTERPAWGLVVHPNSSLYFSNVDHRYKLVGVWGHGDGYRFTPWDATGVTGTVATTGGTSLTISTSGGLIAGQTILIGAEQMFVSSVATTTATVTRAVNGTTATTHTGAATYTAAYPPTIVQECVVRATGMYRAMSSDPALLSEGIGDYRYQRFASDAQRLQERQRVAAFVRGCV